MSHLDCSACEGYGSVAGRCLIPASYLAPAEYEEHECRACHGTGESLACRVERAMVADGWIDAPEFVKTCEEEEVLALAAMFGLK